MKTLSQHITEKLVVNKDYKDPNDSNILNIIKKFNQVTKGVSFIYTRLGNVLYLPGGDDRLMNFRSMIISSLKEFDNCFSCGYAANTLAKNELENNELFKELISKFYTEKNYIKCELKFESDPKSRKYNQQYVLVKSDNFVLHFIGPNIFNKKQDKFVAPEKWGYFDCVIGYND